MMEQGGTQVETEHVIDMTRNNDPPPTSAHDRISNSQELVQHGDRSLSSTRASIMRLSLHLSNVSNSETSSRGRRGNNHARRLSSPFDSGLWISVELILTVAQIVASVVVLSLSRHEHSHRRLFAWIVGYSCGCVATIPLLCWRYIHCNQVSEQESSQSRHSSSGGNPSVARAFSHSPPRALEVDHHAVTSSLGRTGGQTVGVHNARLKASVEYAKMGFDCYFAIWFVIGNVWIFGGHASPTDAPNMYRLCVVFLAFSCIGYAMPLIFCATICCCLPCVISVLGFREDLNQTRGATAESINALPTYKFKLKKSRNKGSTGSNEGGVVAAGTEKERLIAGEDATCCICLAKYANNDELRELPCSHLLHKECVDKWLKINANCPLCKKEVGESDLRPQA